MFRVSNFACIFVRTLLLRFHPASMFSEHQNPHFLSQSKVFLPKALFKRRSLIISLWYTCTYIYKYLGNLIVFFKYKIKPNLQINNNSISLFRFFHHILSALSSKNIFSELEDWSGLSTVSLFIKASYCYNGILNTYKRIFFNVNTP